MKLLSIDAWRDADGGWYWNAWYPAGAISADRITTPRKLLATLREGGWLRASTAGKLAVEDDGMNLVVVSRHTREPLYAVVYAEAEEPDETVIDTTASAVMAEVHKEVCPGDILNVRAHVSEEGQGLTYPAGRYTATENGCSGGWDVIECVNEAGQEVAIYGHSIESKDAGCVTGRMEMPMNIEHVSKGG